MKKIVTILCSLLLVLGLTGCGNMSMGMGTFSFKHIHFSDAVAGYCGSVEKWHDDTTGIEVKTTEYGSLYASEGSYILFSDASKCPYCK